MTHVDGGPGAKHDPWARCLAISRTQYGLITTKQALSIGLTERRLAGSVRRGVLRRHHWGIYALVGAPHSHEQKLLAACLAGGPSACVSHRSAAWLWGLDGADSQILEISSPARVRMQGVHVHRSTELGPSVTVIRRGLPVTKLPRTLVDLACVVTEPQLEIALDYALSKRLVHADHLVHCIDEHGRGKKGVAGLRRALKSSGMGTGDSGLETKFRRIIHAANVPQPVYQHRVHDAQGYVGRLDAAWPERLLAVELDSFTWHGKRPQWRSDLRRGNRLLALGWRVIHLTAEDLTLHRARTVLLLQHELGTPPMFGT